MAEIWGVAVAAGVGSIASGVMSANASKSAANAQVGAADQSNQTQLELEQANAGLQTPGRNLGYGADALLAQLYGLPNPNAASTTDMYGANQSLNGIGGLPGGVSGGGTANGVVAGQQAASTTGGAPATATANGASGALGGSGVPIPGTTASGTATGAPAAGSANYSNFYNTPGYQFNLSQGEQAIQRGASANGSLYSSNTLNQLGTYAQGVASNQYNNYVSQLMGIAGIGTGATNATGAAATTAGNNISSNQLSAGNANASGILGSAGAYSGAIQNAGGQLGNYALLNQLNTSP